MSSIVITPDAEEPGKEYKSSAGPCCPVQHKIAVLFMKIAGNAQGFHYSVCRNRV